MINLRVLNSLTVYTFSYSSICAKINQSSINQSMDQSTILPFYQSINQSINQSMDRSTNQSINQSINGSINQSIDQSINQWIDQPFNQTINQSINGPINHSIKQSINGPINHLINQSTNQSTNQSIDGSINHSTNQIKLGYTYQPMHVPHFLMWKDARPLQLLQLWEHRLQVPMNHLGHPSPLLHPLVATHW